MTTKQSATNLIPVKSKAPISKLSNEHVKVTLQHYRIENKALKSKIDELQLELERSLMKISGELSEDLISIVAKTDQCTMSPFIKFFWEEQQKYLKISSKGIRYHPMIIRYCLSLTPKLAAAYDEIRDDANTVTGFVILLSRRRLRDYKNYVKPQRGFNQEIIQELCSKIKGFSEQEKFAVILKDEMKIQENLVWDKHTGELIGYVDLGNTELNYVALPKANEFSSHVIVFLVRSIAKPLKFILATFATKDIQASQISPLLWKALRRCELNSLKVIAVTCDGASANRKLSKMHFHLRFDDAVNPNVDVTYRRRNVHNLQEQQFIYLMYLMYHIYQKPPEMVYIILVLVNTLATCGNVECLFYGTILLIYFMKNANAVFIFFPSQDFLRTHEINILFDYECEIGCSSLTFYRQ